MYLAQSTKLSVHLKDISILEVFKQIESQSEFVFIYKNEIIDSNQKVSVKADSATVDIILNEILKNLGLKYEILDKQVVITPDRKLQAPEIRNEKPVAPEIQPQKKELKGKVTDTKGQAIPGTTVIIKGTTIGTITGNDGGFILLVPPDAEFIVFSFVGFKSQEVSIEGKTTFNVVLEEVNVGIEDVIVVGYGIQKKENVVGAISQVKGTELVKAANPTVAGSLTGRVPGMVTVQQVGTPGAEDPKIYIRGLSSFTGNNQPLVLVDGIERTMSDIDPNDVETISVLKDASATAVFGVKGGNGVILITTKRGQEGRMYISVNFQETIKMPVNHGIQEGSYPTLLYRDMLYRNTNQYNKVLGFDILEHYRLKDEPYIYPDVDQWENAIKPFTLDQYASISASGGAKKTKYFVSLGYLHEGDMLKTVQELYDAQYKYDRLNFRMNFDFDFTRSTKVSFSTSGYVGTMSFGGQSGSRDQATIVNQMYSYPPYLTPYVYPASFVSQYPDPDNPIISDRLAGVPSSPSTVLGYIKHNYNGTSKTTRDHLGTDISITQNLDFLTKGLSFKAIFSYNTNSSWSGGDYIYSPDRYIFTLVGNTYQWDRYIYLNADDYSVVAPPYKTTVTRSGNPYYSYVYSGQFDYNRTFNKNNINALVLAGRRISQSGAGFPHYEENWVGRVTYNFDQKYLFEANIGISGSEQFAPSNRFGYFPAVGVGWNMAKESFMEEVLPKVNNFKFRYSYGESGNDNTGSQWLYISEFTNWSSSQTGSPGLSKNILTVKEGKVPNLNARWERAKKHDLGIDLGLFNNSITFTGEIYSENRDGILMSRNAVADWFGQSILPLNIGSTKRHGFELEAGYNSSGRKFHYWIKGNYNFNENRVINRDDPAFTPDYQKREGKPIDTNYGVLNIGYYSSRDEIANYSLRQSTLMTIGADKLLDFSGDATTANDAVPIGKPYRPNKTLALSAGCEYKNFDFNFLCQGSLSVDRNWGTPSNPMWTNDPGEWYIKVKGADDIWTPDNQDAAYANWGAWNPGSKSLLDAKYIRLKSVDLGYTVTGRFLKALGLSSTRLSVQGSNLLTWAPGYILSDPENETNSELGNEYPFDWYPIPKRIIFALKVNF